MQQFMARFFPTFFRVYRESPFFQDASLFAPVLGAFILPIYIGVMSPNTLADIWIVIRMMMLIAPLIILFTITVKWISGESFIRATWQYLRPLPSMYVFGTDLKRERFPWVTLSLVLANVIVFFCETQDLVDWGAFSPHGEADGVNRFLSIFTSAFLHGDLRHLAGNALFLWVFGSALEPRVGHNVFLRLYVAAIVASNFFVLLLLGFESFLNPAHPMMDDFHSIGASGAIAGIMGVFAVRCFFARVTISFPFFLVPFLSIPLRVQGIFLLGLFFAMDLNGSVRMLIGSGGQVDYWAHVGGYLGGFILGYLMGLHKDASREAVRNRAARCSESIHSQRESFEIYERILKEEPDNEAALEYMFRKYAPLGGNKAATYLAPLVDVLIPTNFLKAVDLVNEQFPKFVREFSGAALYRLGDYYFARRELAKARVVFDFASEKEGPFQAKSLMMLGECFEALGGIDRARQVFRQIAERFPDTAFERAAIAKVRVLGECVEEDRP